GPYLAWPVLAGSETINDLPKLVVCPFRKQFDLLLEPYPAATFGLAFWNTGYIYAGGLMDGNHAGSGALKPDHLAHRRGKSRGILWGDNLALLTAGGAPAGWSYFHLNGSHEV